MRGHELLEKLTDIDDAYIEKNMYIKKRNYYHYVKWFAPVACLVLLLVINNILNLQDTDKDNETIRREVVLELNDKAYGVIDYPESIAYSNYNLEKEITPDIVGDYLGESIVRIDAETEAVFKVYQYINAPVTEYDWYPRLIIESPEGDYYHTLIGSRFYEDEQTSDEVLEVYGFTSENSIISIENKSGKKIIDRDFIKLFYNGLITETYGDYHIVGENVYQNSGIDESEIDQLYTKYADDRVYLKVVLKNGLVIPVDFTSHNYVEVGNGLYFQVDDSWLELVSIFK